MGAIFVVVSSIVSHPPPELQVADTLITLSWNCTFLPSRQLFFCSNPSQVPMLVVRCHSNRFFCVAGPSHRFIVSLNRLITLSRYVQTAEYDTVPTHETHYFATKVENFKVPQWCILMKTSSILNRRWNWVHFLCDAKWLQPRLPPSSFLSHSPSLMVQIHWGHFFWKIKFHLFFSVECMSSFHSISFTLIWTAVGTSTFKQNSYLFSWRAHHKCRLPIPVQHPFIPGALPQRSIPQYFSILGHQTDGGTDPTLLFPPFLMCPFMSPMLLSSQLHFHALLYRFWSPFVHNVMLFMSSMSAISAFISCSSFYKLYIELYRDHFQLY